MTTTAAPATTYLQRCIEESSPGNITSLQVKSVLWRTAAVATYVAYTALTIGAIAGAILYMPVYVPLVAIVSLVTKSLVNVPYNYFDRNAESIQFRLGQIKAISRHEEDLASQTLPQLQTNLIRKGIFWFSIPGMAGNPSALATLKPLIARLEHYGKKKEECETEMTTTLDQIGKLTAENKPENQESIARWSKIYINIEHGALTAKISSAFMHAVILRPGFTGKFKEMGSFSTLSPQERSVGQAVNPAAVSDFYTFKNASRITYDQAKRMSVPELASRFIAAMPA